MYDECEHLLFYEGDEGIASCPPLAGTELPHVPEELEVEEAWSDDQLGEAFGDLLPLVQAYYDLQSEVFSYALAEEMVGRLSAPVRAVAWFCDRPMLSSSGTDYYTDQRAAAAAEVQVMLEQLAAGFQRLAQM